jgi:hypothetical protein
VHFGTVVYGLDNPVDLLARWRDAMRVAPEELSSTLTPRMPGAAPSATVLLCYAGGPGTSESEANAAVEPLLGLGTVTEASIATRRYSEILEDAERPPHLRLITRNTLVATLDDAVIAATLRLPANPVPTAVAVRGLGGAFGRVPADATAFAHRDAEAMIVALLMLPETATEPEVAHALRPWHAVAAAAPEPTSTSRARRRPRTWRRPTRHIRTPGWPRSSAPTTPATGSRPTTTSNPAEPRRRLPGGDMTSAWTGPCGPRIPIGRIAVGGHAVGAGLAAPPCAEA